MAGHQLIALLNLVGYMCSELYTQQKSDLTRRMMLEINLLVWPECMLMLNVSSFWRGKNLVWGLRLWRAERAPVWELSWYWLELSALKNAIFANANIKFLEDSFTDNNHTYTDERYLNLDLFNCNHKSWMSPWAEIFMIHVVTKWGDNSIKILGLA